MRDTKFLIFLFIILITGCRPQRPSGVLSESRMIDILTDYHLAQGMSECKNDNSDNGKRYQYVQAVFRKHHITEKEFDRSMIYYCENADKLDKMYEEINNRIRVSAALVGVEHKQESKPRYADLEATGDTANIWNGLSTAIVCSTPLENIYRFSLSADSTFYKGDSFIWSFTTQSVAKTGRPEVFVQLVIRYENDSVAANTQLISGNQEHTVRVKPRRKQDTLNIRSIDGYLSMPLINKSDDGFHLMVFSEMALVRCHIPEQERKTKEVMPADTTATDTTENIIQEESETRERISPSQLREAQPRDQRIDVQKEKPINPNARPNRDINRRVRH